MGGLSIIHVKLVTLNIGQMNEEEKIIKPKLGLLELAKQLGNVSQACKVMGQSRDSFYRFKQLYDTGGEQALKEISGKKPIVKNRINPELEKRVVAFAVDQPVYGQLPVSNELKKESVFISPGGVRSVWLRNDLESRKKRLKGLEKAKQEKVAHGEIETHHPCYLGSQHTYYLGNSKGVGKIYAQTCIDS